MKRALLVLAQLVNAWAEDRYVIEVLNLHQQVNALVSELSSAIADFNPLELIQWSLHHLQLNRPLVWFIVQPLPDVGGHWHKKRPFIRGTFFVYNSCRHALSPSPDSYRKGLTRSI